MHTGAPKNPKCTSQVCARTRNSCTASLWYLYAGAQPAFGGELWGQPTRPPHSCMRLGCGASSHRSQRMLHTTLCSACMRMPTHVNATLAYPHRQIHQDPHRINVQGKLRHSSLQGVLSQEGHARSASGHSLKTQTMHTLLQGARTRTAPPRLPWQLYMASRRLYPATPADRQAVREGPRQRLPHHQMCCTTRPHGFQGRQGLVTSPERSLATTSNDNHPTWRADEMTQHGGWMKAARPYGR